MKLYKYIVKQKDEQHCDTWSKLYNSIEEAVKDFNRQKDISELSVMTWDPVALTSVVKSTPYPYELVGFVQVDVIENS